MFELEVGDCFTADQPEGELRDVDVVGCDEPHRNEVFHAFRLDPRRVGRDDFPGTRRVARLAAEGCAEAFQDYVGSPVADSAFVINRLTPTAASWDAGDREVLCILGSDADRIRSASGSGE